MYGRMHLMILTPLPRPQSAEGCMHGERKPLNVHLQKRRLIMACALLVCSASKICASNVSWLPRFKTSSASSRRFFPPFSLRFFPFYCPNPWFLLKSGVCWRSDRAYIAYTRGIFNKRDEINVNEWCILHIIIFKINIFSEFVKNYWHIRGNVVWLNRAKEEDAINEKLALRFEKLMICMKGGDAVGP